MVVPRIDLNSKIMQCHTCGKNALHKAVCPEPALVFNDAHDLRASYGMFYTHPDSFAVVPIFVVFHATNECKSQLSANLSKGDTLN